jgi:hypothetical protein
MTELLKTESTLKTKIQSLPAAQRSQVEDFVDFLLTKLASQGAVSEDSQLRQAAAKLSEPAFAAVWDNAEDAVYDDEPLNDCGCLINDYTKERDRWLGDRTLDNIWAELKPQQDS